MTDSSLSPTVFGVPTIWPYEDFRDYVRALMDAAGIADYAELSRLSGVSETQLSNWKHGRSRPKPDSLRKIAKPLGLKSATPLLLVAELVDSNELDLAVTPDMRVLPVQFRNVAELLEDERVTEEQRLFILRSLSNLEAGVRAEWAAPKGRKDRPDGRRRAG